MALAILEAIAIPAVVVILGAIVTRPRVTTAAIHTHVVRMDVVLVVIMHVIPVLWDLVGIRVTVVLHVDTGEHAEDCATVATAKISSIVKGKNLIFGINKF